MIRILALAAGLALSAVAVAAQQGNGVLIVPPEQDGNIIPPGQRLQDGTVLERMDDGSLLEPDLDLEFIPDDVEPVAPPVRAVTASGGVVRVLDRTANQVVDIEMGNGDTQGLGKLQVTLGGCRYPEDNPSGDAYAYLVIREAGEEVPVFEGWMVASSPALNALDHPRYDVWVLRCNMS
ncbi:DUF2155 domain-containing protein [Psychromarinibacter sp. S121]|uniref:DUF2155 domain-containing protein n=1 Tax=Psychromarinibacter sp. S121 TaxID=3415127 RepID=UPI003C7BD9CF